MRGRLQRGPCLLGPTRPGEGGGGSDPRPRWLGSVHAQAQRERPPRAERQLISMQTLAAPKPPAHPRQPPRSIATSVQPPAMVSRLLLLLPPQRMRAGESRGLRRRSPLSASLKPRAGRWGLLVRCLQPQPTAADIRIKNAAVQAKNGVRQPPKKPVSEKRAEASADRTASSVKSVSLHSR